MLNNDDNFLLYAWFFRAMLINATPTLVLSEQNITQITIQKLYLTYVKLI